jgi:class 3 adenylate cyclase/tetratricopeptide (TPR) repeat protein
MPAKTIADWLTQIGLQQYAVLFAQNEIDLEVLTDLVEEDLEKLGIPLGHRKKLLRAFSALQNEVGQKPAAAPSVHSAGTQAERRQLTVMFCDLVDSTALSQRLDPEQYRDIVRAYQTASAEVVRRFEGHIAQYLGDGLLIYFGYPAAHEDDAQRAVRAGLEIVADISCRKDAPAQLAVRIGIHTGLVVVGEVGAGRSSERLALGGAPNVAARVQGLAEPNSVVISAATRRLVEGRFALASLGEQALKGVERPVEILRVLSASAPHEGFDPREASHALVGRDQEIGLLLDRWERTIEGNGQVVLLVGEPGIGKSRLVRALDERLGSTPHHRTDLRCSPFYTHTPLYPFLERLPARFGWAQGDSPEQEIAKLEATLARFGLPLEESVPLLVLLLSRPAPAHYPLPAMSPQRQRRRSLETLAALLLRMAAEWPVLLAVEDLHWADPTTLELIGQHIEQAPSARLLILLTARPGFESPWGTRSYLTHLILNRLTRRQAEQFINNMTAGKALPQQVLRQIVDKTDGVPLFVEEVTKAVLESQLLQDAGNSYELVGPLPTLAIPSTLQDSLTARLDRLPAGRQVIQLAATLGRTFSYELIHALSGLDESSLTHELDGLVEAELLYQKGFPPASSYVFKHALIQDAAYQSLLKSTRQQLHRRVSGTLVERFPEEADRRPEYVAHHCTHAGLMHEAAGYWRLAGQRAAQSSAFSEAIAHFRRGLEALAALPTSRERDQLELELQLALAYAIIPLRGYAAPEAEQAYVRAAQLAEALEDTARLIDALWGLCASSWVGYQAQKGRQLAERCLSLSQNAGSDVDRLASHHAMACTSMTLGRFTEARFHFERVLEWYGPDRRPEVSHRFGTDLKINALHFLAPILWFVGYPEQALARCKELAEFWPDTPFLYNRIWGSVSLVQVLVWLMHPQGYEAQIDSDLALCQEQGFDFMQTVISTLRGARLAQQGKVEQGIADIRQGIAIHRVSGVGFSVPLFHCCLADALRSIKQVEAGLEAVAEGLAAAQQSGELRVDAELHRLRGELLLMQVPPDGTEAESAFVRALAIARGQEAKSPSCARRSVSPASGCLMRNTRKRTTCLRRSTPGSPRASTPGT